MDAHDIRLKCLELAIGAQKQRDPTAVIDTAEKYCEYVNAGNDQATPKKRGARSAKGGQGDKSNLLD